MKLTKILTLIVFFIFIVVGIILWGFWRIGVLKKEATIPPTVIKIKERINYVQNYPFGEVSNYLSNLTAQRLEIPKITPEEIGKESLF